MYVCMSIFGPVRFEHVIDDLYCVSVKMDIQNQPYSIEGVFSGESVREEKDEKEIEEEVCKSFCLWISYFLSNIHE